VDINKFDYIVQNPWSLMIYGIFFWFLGKWGIYAVSNKQSNKKVIFHNWMGVVKYNLLFTLFALYFMIAWDDEIIDHYFTGRSYEQFSDSVYLLTAPIASIAWYIVGHFNDFITSAFKLILRK